MSEHFVYTPDEQKKFLEQEKTIKALEHKVRHFENVFESLNKNLADKTERIIMLQDELAELQARYADLKDVSLKKSGRRFLQSGAEPQENEYQNIKMILLKIAEELSGLKEENRKLEQTQEELVREIRRKKMNKTIMTFSPLSNDEIQKISQK